jgi:hypothetical protein
LREIEPHTLGGSHGRRAAGLKNRAQIVEEIGTTLFLRLGIQE